MKNQRISSKIIFLILGYIVASGLSCSSIYIGQILPPNFAKFDIDPSGQGNHLVFHKHLILDFDYAVDFSTNTIRFDGIISFKKQLPFEDVEVKDFYLIYSFLDEQNRIIDIVNGPNILVESTANRVKWNEVLPFDPRYNSVTYGYYFYSMH